MTTREPMPDNFVERAIEHLARETNVHRRQHLAMDVAAALVRENRIPTFPTEEPTDPAVRDAWGVLLGALFLCGVEVLGPDGKPLLQRGRA